MRRALAGLRDVGLLTWQQRLVRCEWPAGGAGATRVEQTSNAYAFLLPTEPIAAPLPRPVSLRMSSNCGGQTDRETPSLFISIGLPVLDEAEKQRLDAIQAARKEQRDAEWRAERAERWSWMT